MSEEFGDRQLLAEAEVVVEIPLVTRYQDSQQIGRREPDVLQLAVICDVLVIGGAGHPSTMCLINRLRNTIAHRDGRET